MGSRSNRRTASRSSIVPAEEGVIKKSGGRIVGLPAGYGELLGEIKARIARSRIEAALAANHVLIDLYWHIGRSIVERQKLQKWGRSVVERLAMDIQSAFPGIPGFSALNIWRMRAFYLAYAEEVTILSRPVTELESPSVPRALKSIPWGHNLELLFKLKDPARRLWYAQKALEHGWSLPVLVQQIKSELYERQGDAVTNFDAALPPAQSDLAKQAIKDPYVFDFLTMSADAAERDLERGLIAEYALRNMSAPIGVSEYRLATTLPEDLKGSLPSVEELEAELRKSRDR